MQKIEDLMCPNGGEKITGWCQPWQCPTRPALGKKPLLEAQQLAQIFHMRVHRKSEFSCIFFYIQIKLTHGIFHP